MAITLADIEAEIARRGGSQPTTQGITLSDIDAEIARRQKLAGISKLDSGLRGTAQGLTFNFADEIAGAGGAVADQVGGFFTGNETPSFIDSYRQNRDESRANFEQAREANPGSFLAGEIGGAVLPSILAPGSLVARAIPAAGKLLASAPIARGAVEGVGLGGLFGLGASDADLTQGEIGQAAQDTGISAALGGALGGLVPTITQGIPNAVKSLGRVNKEAVQTFEEAGITPSLAAVSDSPVLRRTQNILGEFPGGSERIQASVQQSLDEVTEQLNKFGLSKAKTPQQAGSAIQEGLLGGLERGKVEYTKAYNKLDELLPPETPIKLDNSIKKLQQLTSHTKNPEVLAVIKQKKGYKLLDNLIKSSKNQPVTKYDAKFFRQEVGKELGDKFTIGDKEREILDQAYGALAEDLKAAAASHSDEALQTFKKADKLFSEYISDVNNNIKGLLNKNTPEQMYQAITQGTKLGGTKAESIMSKLTNDEREVVRGSVLQQLGGGAEQFNPISALTKFNKLATEAKEAFFKGATPDLISNFNKVSKAAERLREVAASGNPSGSGYMSNLGLFLSGSLLNIPSAVATVAGANISARLMTSPKFINWLASSTKPSVNTPSKASAAIKKLSTIAGKNPEIREDILFYLDSIQEDDSQS